MSTALWPFVALLASVGLRIPEHGLMPVATLLALMGAKVP